MCPINLIDKISNNVFPFTIKASNGTKCKSVQFISNSNQSKVPINNARINSHCCFSCSRLCQLCSKLNDYLVITTEINIKVIH